MTDKQRALLDKAKKSLRFAEQNLLAGGPEFASSRAYYSMFYVAEAFLLSKGLTFKKHSAVHSAFGLHFGNTDQTLREFHHLMLTAQESRMVGDYLTDDIVRDVDAAAHIENARRFIELAEKMLGEAPN
jgi:uncharacterized protein (UPF0332 family)